LRQLKKLEKLEVL
jgi:hypothetical protein